MDTAQIRAILGDAVREDGVRIPVITCAVCGKRVDRVEVWENPARAETVVAAYCHGQRDEMRMSAFQLVHMSQAEIDQMLENGGVAFQGHTTKAIAAHMRAQGGK